MAKCSQNDSNLLPSFLRKKCNLSFYSNRLLMLRSFVVVVIDFIVLNDFYSTYLNR